MHCCSLIRTLWEVSKHGFFSSAKKPSSGPSSQLVLMGLHACCYHCHRQSGSPGPGVTLWVSVGVPWLEKGCWIEGYKFKPESKHLNPWTVFSLILGRGAFDLNGMHLVSNITPFYHISDGFKHDRQSMKAVKDTTWSRRTSRPGSDTNSVIIGQMSNVSEFLFHLSHRAVGRVKWNFIMVLSDTRCSHYEGYSVYLKYKDPFCLASPYVDE